MTIRYRKARETAGLSLGQAAKLLGWKVTDLSLYELGSLRMEHEEEKAMAACYGCSAAWLRGETAALSPENETLLRTVEHTGDRETLREFMLMISTRDPGEPAQPSAAERLAKLSAAKRDMPIPAKRSYVKHQGQTRSHHCHWPGCDQQVPPAMWGCKAHWFSLPKALRDRIWRAYQPGQEVDLTPSEEYLQVADDAQKWISAHPKPKGNP